MVIYIPVGQWTNKFVIRDWEEMSMGVVIVNWQIEQGMEHHTEAQNSDGLPAHQVGSQQAYQRNWQGMEQRDRTLPKWMIITL